MAIRQSSYNSSLFLTPSLKARHTYASDSDSTLVGVDPANENDRHSALFQL